MNEFIYQNPVKLIFGEQNITEVIFHIKQYGNKVLLVMGGNSFQSNGYYSTFTKKLSEAEISYIDFAGNSYPSLKRTREAITICREQEIDVVLGIGGGTCMDMAKAIAFGAKQDEDIWKYLVGELPVENKKRLAIGTIVTYPSSGSEMDGATQITDDETMQQVGLTDIYPDFSWINPDYMLSIDEQALAYGQITTFVQISTAYLGLDRCYVSEAIAETLIRTIFTNLDKALESPMDKNTRGNLLLTSALNVSGLTSLSKSGDWSIYPLEGLAQNYFGVEYKKAITILFPYWLKHVYNGEQIFKDYFQHILGISVENKSDELILEESLEVLLNLYRKYGIATNFSEVSSITEDIEKLHSMIKEFAGLPSQYGEFTFERIELLMKDAMYGNLK